MRNRKLLFLDDYRQPIDCASYMYRRSVDCRIYHEKWHIVRTYDEFVQWITDNGLPDFISFDHDLGDTEENKNEEYTGMDCAEWLVNYCMDNNQVLPDYAIHSSNPAGLINIGGLLRNFNQKFNVETN